MKLENILVDQNGYLKVIDYGLAKMLKDNEMAATFCGTPEYLAPEMISNEGHGKAVDWWALGILIYEMLIGVTPFFNRNKNMLFTKIQSAKVIFPDRKKYRIDYSDEIIDLVVQLLNKDKTKRLGSKNDMEEIKAHRFFNGFDFKALEAMQIKPPFKPNIKNEKDYDKYFNTEKDMSAINDTYIPRQNQKAVIAHQDMFEDFNKRHKK